MDKIVETTKTKGYHVIPLRVDGFSAGYFFATYYYYQHRRNVHRYDTSTSFSLTELSDA